MTKLLLIALGGSAGALLRYLVSGWVQQLSGGSFPLGTLIVNLIGCLAIGFLAAVFTGPLIVREEYRIAVLVGLLGSFTTFSTFGYETLTLIRDGALWPALASVTGNVVLGVTAVWLGRALVRLF